MPIMSEQHPWRQMRSDELYEALGLDPKKHLPDEGHPGKEIQGYLVYILSKPTIRAMNQMRRERREEAKAKGKTGRSIAQAQKRTYAICPLCKGHYEFGHLSQHERTHRDKGKEHGVP